MVVRLADFFIAIVLTAYSLLGAGPFSDHITISSMTDETVEPLKSDDDLAALGRQIYLDNYCAVCHTLKAIDANGVFGPSHDQMATVALERIDDDRYRGMATTAEAYIRESILKPEVYTAPGSMIAHQQMPPYLHLPEEEIDALVFLLMQQK